MFLKVISRKIPSNKDMSLNGPIVNALKPEYVYYPLHLLIIFLINMLSGIVKYTESTQTAYFSSLRNSNISLMDGL